MTKNRDQAMGPMSARAVIGAVLRDTSRGRVGLVVNVSGETVKLRPPGRGEPWTAQLVDLCTVSPSDEIRVKAVDFNRQRTWLP